MNICAVVVLSVASIGCALAAPPKYDIDKLRRDLTPQSWAPGAVWSFDLPKEQGAKTRLTYRVTRLPAETCPPGDWFQLEPVGAVPEVMAGTPLRPAYRTFGRYLIIHPVSNVCDMDEEIRGELKGEHFEGESISSGMLGSVKLGPVRGWRVP